MKHTEELNDDDDQKKKKEKERNENSEMWTGKKKGNGLTTWYSVLSGILAVIRTRALFNSSRFASDYLSIFFSDPLYERFMTPHII